VQCLDLQPVHTVIKILVAGSLLKLGGAVIGRVISARPWGRNAPEGALNAFRCVDLLRVVP